MNSLAPSDTVLADVKVPASLVARPDRFGGERERDCLRGDLVIRDGRALRLERAEVGGECRGLVLPRLTECHVHLDKCHSISRMDGGGGDLQAAIAAQAEDRKAWTREDLAARGARGLAELVEAGCGAVRSHLDWPHGAGVAEPPLAWHVLCDLRQRMAGRVELQVAPLVGAEDLADAGLAEAVARLVAQAGGVLGVFVFDQPSRRAGIEQAFRVAERHGLALDFHVDEGLAEGLDGLELVADAAIETGFRGPVLCGHACSLMNLDARSLDRVSGKLALAGIAVAALPSTNLYLQGRTGGTPDRRGITRILELRAADVPVVVGTDNVRDAFCPLGRHDPLQSLALAALAAHLDPPFGDHLPMISTDAERALGLEPTWVDGAAAEDLLLCDAASTTDLLAGAGARRPLPEALARLAA